MVGWLSGVSLWCQDDSVIDALNSCESTEMRVGEGAEHHNNQSVSVGDSSEGGIAIMGL